LRYQFALVLESCSICRASAQDVPSIIDRIQAEQAKPVGKVVAPQPPKPAPPDKPQKSQRAPRMPFVSRATYFHPKDRLPGNIAGQYLIGEFFVCLGNM